MRAPGGPRLLLRRLREVMAEPVTAQARLDRIVVLIASNMVAEVCSVYVARADGPLELFATEGLNREAVHLTTMRPGEGLVGLIAATAEPLALSDAQNHPGLLLQAGDRRGDLSVLPRACRCCAAGDDARRSGGAEPRAPDLLRGRDRGAADDRDGARRDDRVGRIAGHRRNGRRRRRPAGPAARARALAEGIGLGHVVLHEPRVVVEDRRRERRARGRGGSTTAIEAMRAAIDALIERGDDRRRRNREVLETVRMFAHDKGWLRRMREAVTSGLTAEAAVERVQSDKRARMMRRADPYLRERLHDLDDLTNRSAHADGPEGGVGASLPENAILVARTMGPAALLDYDRARCAASSWRRAAPRATWRSSPGARHPGGGRGREHHGARRRGDAIIVDGVAGEIHVRPARGRGGLRRDGAAARPPAGAVPGAARPAGADARRGADRPAPQRRAAGRSAAPRGDGRRGRRPVPHRTAVHGGAAIPRPRRSRNSTARCSRGRRAGDGAHPRHRRRQDPALHGKLEEENPALGWRAIRIGLDRPAPAAHAVPGAAAAAAGRDLRSCSRWSPRWTSSSAPAGSSSARRPI